MKPEISVNTLSDAIRQYDEKIFSFIQNEASHGLPHAMETAELTFPIAEEPEYRGVFKVEDRIMLRHAALLHDIGYSGYKSHWTGTQQEHPYISAEKAAEILTTLEFYKDRPDRLGTVLWLIFNHDNTNYTFPAYQFFEQPYLNRDAPDTAMPVLLPGTVRQLPPEFEKYLGTGNLSRVDVVEDKRIDMLQVLQEADSRLGDAQRTLDFCRKRGVPLFVNEGGVIGPGPLWWQGSAAANIILALNRALLDAHTMRGKVIAKEIYGQGMSFVREQYERTLENPSFLKPEPGTAMIAGLRVEEMGGIFERSRTQRWRNNRDTRFSVEMVKNLRRTYHDLQYQHGRRHAIASRLVSLSDIFYLSESPNPGGYASSIPFTLGQVRKAVIADYGFDVLTQLPGSASVRIFDPDPVLGNDVFIYDLVPPVIEMNNFSQIGRPPYYIDHVNPWVEEARLAGLEKIRVIFLQK